MMPASANRRQSRGSNGALSGNAMRIVKPSSANNSPRNNLMQQRRRTMMNDPVYYQRAQQALEQPYLPTPGPEVNPTTSYYEPSKKSARPVSWHPSTHQIPTLQLQSMPLQQQQTTQFPFPSQYDYDFYAPVPHMPPTPAAYSAYNSPVSNLSPLQLPSYANYEVPQTYSSPCWNLSAAPGTASVPVMSQVHTPIYADTTTTTTTMSAYTPPQAASNIPSYVEPHYSPASWAHIPATTYNHHVTAPPTPEDPPKLQQPDPVVIKQEPMPYSPAEVVEDDEEEGDILVGLGLYDPPEKLGLLGASFEPTGKGLKLEDAWEPPVEEDDNNDEEDDGDEDGDAESEEE